MERGKKVTKQPIQHISGLQPRIVLSFYTDDVISWESTQWAPSSILSQITTNIHTRSSCVQSSAQYTTLCSAFWDSSTFRLLGPETWVSYVFRGIPQPLDIQGKHKVFPWLQTFITTKLLYVEYKHIYFFFRNITHDFFLTAHQYTSTCAPFVARWTSNR